MRRTLPFFRLVQRLVWWLVVSSVIAAGLVVAVARLGLPLVADYRLEVEQQLQQQLGIRLRVAAVDADWTGVYPELRVSGLELLDQAGEATLLRVERMRITLNLWASWWGWRLQPQDLELSGIDLKLERAEDGRLSVRGWQSSGVTEWHRVVDWLLRHRLIRVAETHLSVQDLGSGLRFEVERAEVYLLNIGNGHRLTASATLAPASGAEPGTRLSARLSAAADLVGETPFASGAFYLAIEDLALELPDIDWLPAIRGHSLALWVQRRDDRWYALEGLLRGLSVQAKDRGAVPLRLADSGIRADLGRHWRVKAGPLVVDRPAATSRSSKVWLDMSGWDDLDLRADRLSATSLTALLVENSALSPEVRPALQAIDPRGELRDLHFRTPHGRADAGTRVGAGGGTGSRLTLRFDDLRSRAWQGVPAVDGMSGAAAFDLDFDGPGRPLGMTLDATGGQVDLAPLFEGPWAVGRLQLDLGLDQIGPRWAVQLHRVRFDNPDLSVEARGTIRRADFGELPYLDLVGAYYRANGERIAPYLPLKGIPKPARDWLVQAVVSGQVTGGGLVFRGAVDRFPFEHGEGVFETSFDVVDAVLNYADDWPRLEQVDAEVEFRGQDMNIYAVGGHIMDADMREVVITLPGLRRPARTLHIDGELDLALTEVRDFILASPLAGRYGPFVDSLDASGDGALHLKLDLPLQHPQDNRVSGELQLDGGNLHWRDADLLLEQVHGTLGFDQDGLHGSAIRVRVFDQPASLDVEPSPNDGGTRIRLTGSLSPKALSPLLGEASAHLRGRTRWRASIGLPRDPGDRLRPRVEFRSDLKGLAVELPAPLGKTAAQALPLRVETRLGGGRLQRVQFGYGERLSGDFEIDSQLGLPRRGALRLGRGSVKLPPGQQLVVSGRLGALSVDAWSAVLGSLAAGRAGTADWLSRVLLEGVRIGRLDLFGQRLTGLTVDARHAAGGWRLRLAGDQVGGQVTIPDDPGRALTLDMDRLQMRPPGGAQDDQPPDPRQLPPMRVLVRDFRFDDLALGRLTLAADKRRNGLKLTELKLDSVLLKVAASGLWELRDSRQYSECEIDFEAPSLGNMLEQLGFANTIRDGETRGRIAANWSGPPTDFALGRLNGRFDIDIGTGTLVQIDPGAGRLFGLLSPQVFTLQLAKRYAELAKEGFYFEEISGQFRLEGGNAYTDSLKVDGPVARIDISGRIGLLARDYNQYVEVIPRVSSGLTLASGALAIGSPPLGAALLVAQTVFGEKLDTIGSRYYLISGSWDDPQLTRLKRPGQ